MVVIRCTVKVCFWQKINGKETSIIFMKKSTFKFEKNISLIKTA